MTSPYDPYKPPTAPLDQPGDGAPDGSPASSNVVALLVQTRPWVKLVSGLMFAGMGLAALGLVVAMAVLPGKEGGLGAVTILPMLFVFALYVPAAVFLWRYGAAISRLEAGGSSRALEEALGNQKSFWKYTGILAVVMIVIYIVAMAGGYMVGRNTRRPPGTSQHVPGLDLQVPVDQGRGQVLGQRVQHQRPVGFQIAG